MNIVGFVSGDSSNSNFAIVENHQNNLKGLLWVSAGAGLTAGSLGLTVATVAVVAGSTLGSAFVGPGPAIVLGGAAILVDYFAVKFTGYCYSNALHHFGPEYQITRIKN